MNLILISLGIYAALALAMVIVVGNALFKNGKVFLYDIFNGDQELTESVNRLLLIGFYLVNVGFILINYNYNRVLLNWSELIHKVCGELGIIMFCLGVIHMINIFLLLKMRKKNVLETGTVNTSQFQKPKPQNQTLLRKSEI